MSNSRKKKHLPPPPLADILGELSDAPHDSGLNISPSSTPADSPPISWASCRKERTTVG
jgi:hypothetical protein